MEAENYSRVAIAGAGTIGCGLAACASILGDTLLYARSPESAERAGARLGELCPKLDGADLERITVVTEVEELGACDLVVESIAEHPETKGDFLSQLAHACPEADLATTTSALSVTELGGRAGRPERFYGLHVFNPVHRMDLVELCFPDVVAAGVRERARSWCRELGKSPIEVPDQPGFVVNRLLFPYLFDAVHLMERTGMSAEDVDACISLGAGHPMGPLALLDFVGIDVAVAIGEAIHAETGLEIHHPPHRLIQMEDAGDLGRKSGRGFFEYGDRSAG